MYDMVLPFYIPFGHDNTITKHTKIRQKCNSGKLHSLPQRLKSMFFEIFSSGVALKEPVEWEKNSKNVDFSLWGNRATTQNTFFDIFKCTKNTFMEKKSETKIMKIAHSALT